MKKLLLPLISLFLVIPCQARTITVDDDGPADFNNIQAAIDDASDGDVVEVQIGTYTGGGNRDIDFGGKAITVCGTDPHDPNIVAATVIDCNGTGDEPHGGFNFQSGEDANSVLAGFTIRNGMVGDGAGIYCADSSPTVTNCTFTGNDAYYWGGGGMYNYYSSPTVTNCTFSDNDAYIVGGGMYNYYSSPRVANCTFSGNWAWYVGGAMYNHGGSPTVTNCTFSGNLAWYFGGGMYNSSSNPTVTNCRFISGNMGWDWGGGMYNYYSSPTVTNCTFSDNWGLEAAGMCNRSSNPTVTNCTFSDNDAYSGGGGGMYNDSSDPTVTNCTFSDNGALVGGGMCNRSSNPTVTNCTFSGNWASYVGGGGMYNDSGEPIVTNCTFSDNFGIVGGGMSNSSSDPTVTNCTFSGNDAYIDGGAVCNWQSSATVDNCILWANIASDGNEIFNDSSTPVISYCDIAGCLSGGAWDANLGSDGGGNIDVDPCFVDHDNGDFRLLPDSPCIDSGDNNSIPADTPDLDGDGDTGELIPLDLGGNPRIVDGNNDGEWVVDMGAYEFFPAIEVRMRFTPPVLHPGSHGRWIKAHLVLPEGFAAEDVDDSTPAWLEPFGIESDHINVFVNEDGLVEIEAAFDRASFCEARVNDNAIEVRVIGSFTNGEYFYGTDTIRIIDGGLKYLAVLASNWLEARLGRA